MTLAKVTRWSMSDNNSLLYEVNQFCWMKNLMESILMVAKKKYLIKI